MNGRVSVCQEGKKEEVTLLSIDGEGKSLSSLPRGHWHCFKLLNIVRWGLKAEWPGFSLSGREALLSIVVNCSTSSDGV